MRRFAWRNDPEDPNNRPAFYYVCDSLDEITDELREGDFATVGGKLYVFTDRWMEIAPGKSGSSRT